MQFREFEGRVAVTTVPEIRYTKVGDRNRYRRRITNYSFAGAAPSGHESNSTAGRFKTRVASFKEI